MNTKTGSIALMALSLVACGGGGGGASPSGPVSPDPFSPVSPSAAAPPPAIPAATTPKPTVDFGRLAFSWLAGSYAGEKCLIRAAFSANETLQINTDGIVSLAGASHNFLPAEIGLTKSIDTNGARTLSAGVISRIEAKSPRLQLIWADIPTERGYFSMQSPALATPDDMVNGCDSSDGSKLLAKALYPLVEQYIEQLGQPMLCRNSTSINASVNYSVRNGVADINGESLPLRSGLTLESLGVRQSSPTEPRGLTYSAYMPDGRSAVIELDSSGTPLKAFFQLNNGVAVMCDQNKSASTPPV